MDLISRYQNPKGSQFYILTQKDIPYSQYGGGSQTEFTKGFRILYEIDGETNPMELGFGFTIGQTVWDLLIDYNIDLSKYLIEFGLYHCKNYLDNTTHPMPKTHHFVLKAKNFPEHDYVPRMSGNRFIPPGPPELHRKRIKIIEDRLLKFLYERKSIQDDPESYLTDEQLVDEMFCSDEEQKVVLRGVYSKKLVGGQLHLNPIGEEYVENTLLKYLETDSKSVFIAQSFDPKILPLYKNMLSKVVGKVGFVPSIVMEHEPKNNIDTEILELIRESSFMIADLTLERPSVYFEAGYAEAIGMKVFYTCHEDHNPDHVDWKAGMPKVHFDIRNRRITWWRPDNYAGPILELISRIQAWQGNQPNNNITPKDET
jgi:hypothetical protein